MLSNPRKANGVIGHYLFHAPSTRTVRVEEARKANESNAMITLDALTVFFIAAAIPAIYLFIVSRWIEAEASRTRTT